MKPLAFDIKIAILGHVSVGKTTVLNAFLREMYSEVSLGRTTAGINYFHLSKSCKSGKRKADELIDLSSSSSIFSLSAEPNEAQADSKDDLSGVAAAASDCELRTAPSTLQEIQNDNAKFRESEKIHEKHFDVEHSEDFCEMRDDTRLVLVDIPGVNEAGSGAKYKKYVEDKWETFDCVVLVLDGRQGVNTEEQVDLLEFVKKNLQKSKVVPVIILCNKVDDPDDDEQLLVVEEARRKVESVFEVDNRNEALTILLAAAKENIRLPLSDQVYPVFIATSAVLAFIYQTASLMSMERFRKFDKGLIEKLGREEVGKWKWKSLSETERYEVAHKAVSDLSLYKERLRATNFDKFLTALAYSVGGNDNQLKLIEKQLSVAMHKISPKEGFASELCRIYRTSMVLDQQADKLKALFWDTYGQYEALAFKKLKRPMDVDCLADPMDEICVYYELTRQVDWFDESKKALDRMKLLFRRQLGVLFDQEKQSRQINWKYGDYYPLPALHAVSWNELSPEDWKSICRSVLLLSYNKHFCADFGQEKVLLESLVDKICHTAHCCCCGLPMHLMSSSNKKSQHAYCKEPALASVLMNGIPYPTEKRMPDAVYRIKVPDAFTNPLHWGHVAWKYCELMEFVEENEKSDSKVAEPARKKRRL